MNKPTDPQPRIYAFVYEFGKNLEGRDSFLKEVAQFAHDYITYDNNTLSLMYPEFKLGEEARQAKVKVENLRPTKKPAKKIKETK